MAGHEENADFRDGSDAAIADRIVALSCWRGSITVEPLDGGLTNRNFLVRERGARFVVRISGDSAVHDIDRAAELAASRAAEQAGLGPAVIHAEPGALVLAHVTGRTLAPPDLAETPTLMAAIDLLRRVGDAMPRFYTGPARDRRPVCVLAAYRRALAAAPAPWRQAAAAHEPAIARLAALPAPPPVFVHGDIHAGNLIDDGTRLWLVDWEYAGMGVAGHDLASLVANGPEGDSPDFAEAALAAWLRRSPSAADRAALWQGRLGATLRDLFWGYAQATIDPAFAMSDYLSINERRVEMVLTHL
jgi:thiamine kinase-like enzyme